MRDTATNQENTFEHDAADVLTRLRSAIADVIAAVPEEVAKGADLHRALRIDRKLGWRVYKIASAIDPMTAGLHVPSRANMSTFFKAALKRGVPERLVESASKVASDFEKLVASHAGDRATFDSMVSALTTEESTDQIDLVHRRLAFRGQRHTLGIYAKTQFKFFALQPSNEPHLVDALRVGGYVGLRRLRGNVPIFVSYFGTHDDEGAPLAIRRRSLEPVNEEGGMSVLPQFCSEPAPELRVTGASQGFVRVELMTRDVGNRAAMTFVEGHVIPAIMPRYRDQKNHMAGSVGTVSMPLEALVLDLLVRRGTCENIKPYAYVESMHQITPMSDGIRVQPLRMEGGLKVDYLGRGPTVLHTPDVPRYAELGRYVFERAGWDGRDFDVYRCRIEYPCMPTHVVLAYELPKAPDD